MTIFQTNCILHGDCTRILPQLPGRSADFIQIDPPVGLHEMLRISR